MSSFKTTVDLTLPSTFQTPTSCTDRSYSKKLDKDLGFNIDNIERQLSEQFQCHNELTSHKPLYANHHAWIGLESEILQTPYQEIVDFFEVLRPYQINSIIDLGSGYGRVGLVMQAYRPDATFIGIEIVTQRSNEANRIFKQFHLNNCISYDWDLIHSLQNIPIADLYFIYDFSEPEDIRILLNYFSKKIDKDNFFLVAKGNGIRSLIQNRYPEFWAAFGVIHHPKWSLYSSFTDLEA